MKRLVLFVLILVFIFIISFYFIFNYFWKKYEIIFYSVENVSDEAKNIFIKYNLTVPYKVESYYVNSTYSILYFYKYHFLNDVDAEDFYTRLIKIFNISKIWSIKIDNHNMTIISLDNQNGVIVRKENKVLLITMKNFEEDLEVIRWFLKEYF